MEILVVGDSKKTKPNKANFRAQTTLKAVEEQSRTPMPDFRSQMSAFCSLSQTRIKKSLGIPTNQQDEAKNYLDGKPVNLL